MDRSGLDLEFTAQLIERALKRTETLTLAEIAAIICSNRLEEEILEALSFSRNRLSEEEQLRFSAIVCRLFAIKPG